MKATLLTALFLAAPLFAAPSLPEICYDTVDGGQFCTTDNVGNVQVFVYNAGWCGPCNNEMDELAETYGQFEGKAVTFASLSGEGWSRGAKPDKQFLSEWKARHHIPFVVAGKFRDFGQKFNSPGSIPFSVIIDKEGNVADKGFLGASEIAERVSSLLGGE